MLYLQLFDIQDTGKDETDYNQTLSTCGCDASGAPASVPKPVRILRTPGGRPTSLQISASSKHVLKYNRIRLVSS